MVISQGNPLILEDFGSVKAIQPKTRIRRFIDWIFSTKWKKDQQIRDELNKPFGICVALLDDDKILVQL